MSQTQLANFAVLGGILAGVLSKWFDISGEQVTFILVTLWTAAWSLYNAYQRYQKGDITLSGVRK